MYLSNRARRTGGIRSWVITRKPYLLASLVNKAPAPASAKNKAINYLNNHDSDKRTNYISINPTQPIDRELFWSPVCLLELFVLALHVCRNHTSLPILPRTDTNIHTYTCAYIRFFVTISFLSSDLPHTCCNRDDEHERDLAEQCTQSRTFFVSFLHEQQ